MKKIALIIISILTLISLCSCGFVVPNSQSSSDNNVSRDPFTVHYHDDNTRTYTPSGADVSVQCEHLAPAGKFITGLFDENGVQYADYDCKVSLTSASIPADLYAKYEDVDISYLKEKPFNGLDEEPTTVSFYKGGTFTWTFDPAQRPDDAKMIAACLCNPYAELTVTVSFEGKGSGASHKNEFFSNLQVCNEKIGTFNMMNLGDVYSKYTYQGTIKAKQLTNGNYEVKVAVGSKYGYEDFTVKNFKLDFDFNFATQN